MPRRPPPSTLRLFKATDPLPSRQEPKHRMPSVPQPAFVPDTTMKSGEDVQDKQTEGTSEYHTADNKPRGRSSSEVSAPAGPWDRSRSFGEGETSVGSVLRPPAVAASI